MDPRGVEPGIQLWTTQHSTPPTFHGRLTREQEQYLFQAYQQTIAQPGGMQLQPSILHQRVADLFSTWHAQCLALEKPGGLGGNMPVHLVEAFLRKQSRSVVTSELNRRLQQPTPRGAVPLTRAHIDKLSPGCLAAARIVNQWCSGSAKSKVEEALQCAVGQIRVPLFRVHQRVARSKSLLIWAR